MGCERWLFSLSTTATDKPTTNKRREKRIMDKEEAVAKQCPMSYNNSHTALHNSKCKKEECQWWIEETKQCVVVQLANDLLEI